MLITWITWIVLALPFSFVCALLYVLPDLSRRTQFFAVTVPPSFRESNEARGIIRTYRYQVLAHSALGACGFVLVAAYNAPAWLELPLLWPAAGSMVAVVRAHSAALRYAVPPSGVRVASLRPQSRRLPGGPLVWVGPFVILAASAAYIASRWNEIPARFPIHWGLNNTPNGWAVRSISGVYLPLFIGTMVCLLMLFFVWPIAKYSRGSTAMRILVTRLLLGLSYFMAAMFGWLTASLPLGHGAPNPANLGLLMLAVVIIIGATVIFGIRAKQEPEPDVDAAGASAPASVLGISVPAGDNSADCKWVGGILYFNPDDPALFIEKRIGIGYDLNFGNPRAWVFIGVTLLIPVAVVLILKL
jgi:uncharacterized membrane protein